MDLFSSINPTTMNQEWAKKLATAIEHYTNENTMSSHKRIIIAHLLKSFLQILNIAFLRFSLMLTYGKFYICHGMLMTIAPSNKF